MKHEPFEFCELTFDFIEPGSICRRPDENDVVLLGPSFDLATMMWGEII